VFAWSRGYGNFDLGIRSGESREGMLEECAAGMLDGIHKAVGGFFGEGHTSCLLSFLPSRNSGSPDVCTGE
jgi:hypothetical protein